MLRVVSHRSTVVTSAYVKAKLSSPFSISGIPLFFVPHPDVASFGRCCEDESSAFCECLVLPDFEFDRLHALARVEGGSATSAV